MTPAPEGASAAADAAVSSSSSDADDDSMMAEEEEEEEEEAIGNGIGPKYETAAAAAALQELMGRAIGQVQGLARGEKERGEGALANEQIPELPWLARLN